MFSNFQDKFLVYVFARRSDNEQLKSISKVTTSSLKYMRDVDLLQRAKAILEAIMENKEAMGPYGVSDELISDLSKKIEIYDAKSNDKEGNFAESKNARQALTEAFEHANEILIEEVDSIMEYIKDIHADFYGKYQ